MNQKFNIPYRLISLFIALSLLPALMLRNSQADNRKSNPLSPLSESLTLAESDIHRYPAAIISSEIFREHYARISQNNKSRRSGFSDIFQLCFIKNILLIAAAYILFILIKLRHENKNISLKFIIRYIHDQDGYKIYDPVY
ncbi:MAG: hypothetical protein IKK47_06550 [Ruminococcus sp.]|nr:hypothetical protein [Ruminococcus sp.]